MNKFFAAFAVLPFPSDADKTCHSIDPRASDDWCQKNCNYAPAPNCPPEWCLCDVGPTPSPSPSPAPTPSPAPSPGPSPAVADPIFELDLFVNDPGSGWQADGFPDYLQHSAARYMNVAGISFIQPSDLMNDSYDLPVEVANAVRVLRKQGVTVQLLVGGQISSGWGDLEGNPEKAATNAIALMKKYDCGIEVDNEAGGDAAGLIRFIQLCDAGKPEGTFMSMDVGGTPDGSQRQVIKGAIDSLAWVNMMVSNPGYDQENSVKFGNQYGVPYEKMTVAYYAGTWVNNCNHMDSGVGGTGAGKKLFDKYGLKGLSIWAVGGMSYHNCRTDDAPGFSEAVDALGVHPLGPAPAPTPTPETTPTPAPTPPPAPTPAPTPEPTSGKCCWSKWGDASTCGSYPAGSSGAICGNDGKTACQSDSDCANLPPARAALLI